jgi:serine/threonine-protein kinase
MVAAGTQLSQYRIVRRIGAGGMAEVFLAQSTGAAGFTRTVAIKTIIAAGAPQESIGLFLDEARVAAMLQHASIVQTLDLGFENDTLFIVMEYVPGPPLSRMIHELKQRQRTVPSHVVAHVGAKIAAALDFAHRRVTASNGQALALVHRDVSPQNILVTRTGVVKLTDFGVARASIQMHKTKTGQVRGKAAYMAPEQVRAQALDGRTDMFALGLVLYEALTGFRPYQRSNEIASMRAIIGEDVPPLRERNPHVPEDLSAVIMRALKRPAGERFAHCGEMEEALAKTIRHHRISAIEDDLRDLLIELFGEEQWNESMPEVEAWQPTIAATETPSTPRFKVSGNLSPELAALLNPTPPGASPATPATPVTPAVADGAAPRAPSLSTDEVIRAVISAGATAGPPTPRSSPSMPMATSPLPVSAVFSPLSTPSLSGTGLSIRERPGVSRWRAVAVVLAALMVGVSLVLLIRGGEERIQAGPIQEPPPAPVLVATPGNTEPEKIKPAPPPKPATDPDRPTRDRPDRAKKAEPTERIERTRDPSQAKAPPTKAPAPPKPAIDRDALLQRLLELKKRAAAQKELSEQLARLANDVLMGRELTPADLETVRSAEKALER